jgi:2-methylcitrate dehydratase
MTEQTFAMTVARYLHEPPVSPLQGEPLEYAKSLLMSCVGAMIAGSRLNAGQMISNYVRGQGGTAQASVAADGWRTTVELAALANGTFAHATEYEDDSFPEGVSTYTLIPPLLAVAEAEHLDGARLMHAFILGHEVQSRVGRAALAALERGYHLLPLLGTVATAGAISYLRGLPVENTAMALCIAASQGHGLRIQTRSMSHFLESGTAARAGILSASLAAVGFTAEPCVFEGRDERRPGLLRTINNEPADLNELLASWTEPYRVMDVSIKAFPMCMLIQPVVEAGRDLKRNHKFEIEDIDSIVIRSNPSLIEACSVQHPNSQAQALFSAQHVLALALIDDTTITLDGFSAEAVNSPQITALRDRMVFDPQAEWPIQLMAAPLGIRITTRSGEVIENLIHGVHGMPPQYLHRDEVVAKYRTAVGRVLPETIREEILEQLENVDKVDDLSRLGALIGGMDLAD